MKFDEYGYPYCSSMDLFDLLYKNPELQIENFFVTDPQNYNTAVKKLHAELPLLKSYSDLFINRDPFTLIEEFDKHNQSNWFMPDNYKQLDIAAFLVQQCKTETELERVARELLLYEERNLFDLLRFLKYLTDTLRQHDIVWGVGRGSSVASYVLYLLGVHKIDSIKYDLDIKEFLK